MGREFCRIEQAWFTKKLLQALQQALRARYKPPFPLTLQNESCYTVASFGTTSFAAIMSSFRECWKSSATPLLNSIQDPP
jgi:hypothetical protein